MTDIECLLSPKAVVQSDEILVKRAAAFGHKRTLASGKFGSGLTVSDVDDHGGMVRKPGFSNSVVVANKSYSGIQF